MAKFTTSTGRKPGFVYQRRDPGLLKQRAEQSGGRFDNPFKQGFDVFRPKQGDNHFRILPPTWENAEHYGYDLYMHRYIGADQSSYLCIDKHQGKTCPVCLAAKEAKDAGEQDEARQLSYGHLVCPWIIDRDADNPTPMLYPMGWSLDREIAVLASGSRRTGKTLYIDHPTEGYDIWMTRTGQKLMTRYIGVEVDREFSPISDDEKKQEEILEYIAVNPVPSTLHFYPAEYLERVISGTSTEKDADLEKAEEEEKPARSVARKPARQAEPEEEEEEEVEASPAQRQQPLSRRPAPVEEEEDEVPFEEEEPVAARPAARKPLRQAEPDEEDETPPPRRAAAPARRPAVEEDEDAEEDEPAPRRASNGARRQAVAEEAEDEVVDEEEEPAPRRPAAQQSRRPAPVEEEEEDVRPARRPSAGPRR